MGWRYNPMLAARRHANTVAHFKGEPLRCGWCRREVRFRDTTGDHIIPVRFGQRSHLESGRSNIVASCVRCNELRAAEAAMLCYDIETAWGIWRKWKLVSGRRVSAP